MHWEILQAMLWCKFSEKRNPQSDKQEKSTYPILISDKTAWFSSYLQEYKKIMHTFGIVKQYL